MRTAYAEIWYKRIRNSEIPYVWQHCCVSRTVTYTGAFQNAPRDAPQRFSRLPVCLVALPICFIHVPKTLLRMSVQTKQWRPSHNAQGLNPATVELTIFCTKAVFITVQLAALLLNIAEWMFQLSSPLANPLSSQAGAPFDRTLNAVWFWTVRNPGFHSVYGQTTVTQETTKSAKKQYSCVPSKSDRWGKPRMWWVLDRKDRITKIATLN